MFKVNNKKTCKYLLERNNGTLCVTLKSRVNGTTAYFSRKNFPPDPS